MRNNLSILETYARQRRWRSWPAILDALPCLEGQLVLDLGCGIGDLAVDLCARGARVVGLDLNVEFIQFAHERRIPNTEFRVADVKTLHEPSLHVDGIWSSFTAAYFPAFGDTVTSWVSHLKPDGWLAVTEIDDLFGHQPTTDRTSALLSRYVQESKEHSRYDFRMGQRLANELRDAGLTVTQEFTVPDAELSFSGGATQDVLEAWRTRFERMYLLRDFCGTEFEHVRDDFLSCLSRDDHSCSCKMRCCIAQNNAPTSSPIRGKVPAADWL